MKWHYPLIFPMLVALLLALPDPAAAAAEFPYQLDRSFSGDGYDLNADAEIARKVAYDGDVAIVAASKSNGDGTVQVRLYRYDKHGNRQPWAATGDVARVLANNYRITAIKDLVASPSSGDLLLLLDRQNSAQDTRIGTILFRIPLSGTSGGTLLAAQPGGQLQQRFLGGQLALAGDTLFMLYSPIDPDAPYVRASIGRDEFHVAKFVASGGSWLLSSSWGVNGVRGYEYPIANCDNPDPYGAPCGLAATRMVYNANDSKQLWIAGNIKGVNVQGLHDDGVFLFRVSAVNGNPDTGFGNAGWVSRKLAADLGAVESAVDLAVRQRMFFVPPNPLKTYDNDAFLLVSVARGCGNGFRVYRYNDDGSYSDSPTVDNGRSYTFGGTLSDGTCDSFHAHAMQFQALGTSGPFNNWSETGALAIVSQLESSSGINLHRESAIVQTLDADFLSQQSQQQPQVIFEGSPNVIGNTRAYDFTATAWHPGLKRLMAVGEYSTSRPAVPPPGTDTTHTMLVSALREAPLFADGFEDD